MGLGNLNPGCGCCEEPPLCPDCTGPMPNTAILTVSGTTNGGNSVANPEDCTNCQVYDGTFYLPLVVTSVGECAWVLEGLTPSPCPGSEVPIDPEATFGYHLGLIYDNSINFPGQPRLHLAASYGTVPPQSNNFVDQLVSSYIDVQRRFDCEAVLMGTIWTLTQLTGISSRCTLPASVTVEFVNL